MVDASDYTVWRDSLATGIPLLNETASLGTVDSHDFDAWKANFGGHRLSGAAATVPEPSTMGLQLFLILFAYRRTAR